MTRFFKIIVYNLFNYKLVNSFLSAISHFVLTVDNLKKYNKKDKIQAKQKYPFLIAVTIDTEPGYVKKNQERVWINKNNRAFQGYYYGIKNWLDLAKKYKIKFTFLLCTQCFNAKGKEYKKIVSILKKAYTEGHEIGFHLHPKHDEALQKHINKKLRYTGARFYDSKTIEQMLFGGRELIKKHLGKRIADDVVSFRWGNWAIPIEKIKLLSKVGFKIDSSSCPGIRGHINDDYFYDWTNLKKHSLFIINGIVELPIATFSFFGRKFRADPALDSLLIKAFQYYYNIDRRKSPFIFVILTHSSEATYQDGRQTYVIDRLERFIKTASKNNLRFVTLKKCLDLTLS